MTKRIFMVFGAASAIFFGCDSSDDVVPLDQFVAKMSAAACDLGARCSQGSSSALSSINDCSVVEPKLMANLEMPIINALIAKKTVVYHGDKVNACIDSLKSVSCDFRTTALEGCLDIFEGKVARGQACTSDFECTTGTRCDHSSACPGTCVARGSVGDPCSDDSCQPELDCVNSLCTAPANKGEACGGVNKTPCAGFLVCAGGDSMTAGTCKSLSDIMTADVGGACDYVSILCKPGLSCATDPSSPTHSLICVTAASTGGTCNTTASPSQCPADEYCSLSGTDQWSIIGTCKVLPNLNEPCGGVGSDLCAVGLGCVKQICTTLQDVGGACDSDSGCWSNICGTGKKCAAPDVTKCE